MSSNNHAIGVFDSGLGGLTVVKELMRQLPAEDIVYYGDTARVPYGTKSKESIIRFSIENADVLLKRKVKMIVVACNSSSSFALPALVKKCSVPIIGVIEPGARESVLHTKNRRIGVVATSATIKSGSYQKAIKRCDKKVKVYSQACPLFVPLAEEGWLNMKLTFDVAKKYLSSIKQSKADVLILGCTHYPLLRKTIAKVVGKNVLLIDSAQVVAQKVKQVLMKMNKLKTKKTKARYTFLVSDKPQEFRKIAKNFLGKDIYIKVA